MNKSTLNFLQNMVDSISILSFENLDTFRKYKENFKSIYVIFEVDLKSFSSFEEKDFDFDQPLQIYISNEQKNLLTKNIIKKIKSKKILLRLEKNLILNNSYIKHHSYYISNIKNLKNTISITQQFSKANLYRCSIYGYKLLNDNNLLALCLNNEDSKCKLNLNIFKDYARLFIDNRHVYLNKKSSNCKFDFMSRLVSNVDSNFIEEV